MDDGGFRYLPRVTDGQLTCKLLENPVVLVRGPKWCGKTTSCERLAKSVLRLRDPDEYARSMEAARVQPSLLLRGTRPRLLDEWQLVPVLWDAAINAADLEHGAPSQFLLTGSATPPKKEGRRHAVTGRIARLDMSPMTLEESGESSGDVSLASLFGSQEEVAGISEVSVEDWSRIICRGGWPSPISHGTFGIGVADEYIKAICESDLEEASGSQIDPDRARALLRSLARNTAQEASNGTIIADVKSSGTGMSEPTLRVYLDALRRIFVVRELKAWAPSLRSRTPLRQARIWHLCDPSLEAAALETDEDGLLGDLNTMGYLFESLCVRDLRVYA